MNKEILDFLKENIEQDCELKIITSKISLRALSQFLPYFKKCSQVKIILTKFINENDELTRTYKINENETEFLTNKFELKLKNDLLDYFFALEIKKIIEKKIEIKYGNNVEASFIIIKKPPILNVYLIHQKLLWIL